MKLADALALAADAMLKLSEAMNAIRESVALDGQLDLPDPPPRKQNGECLDCFKPRLPDSEYCADCRLDPAPR